MLRHGVGVSMAVFAELPLGEGSRLVGVVLCPSGTLRVVVQVCREAGLKVVLLICWYIG